MVHASLLLLGVTTMLCGLLPADLSYFWLFAAFCLFMGASSSLYNIPFLSYLQQNIPPEEMGRVLSLIGSLASLAMPIGLLIAGPVSQAKGVAFLFLAEGVFIVCVTSLSALLTGRRKKDAQTG